MNVAPVVVRAEEPADHEAVRALTDTAFAPSIEESAILDRLRVDEGWLTDLSLVALDVDDAVVGHVVTSRGGLVGEDGITRWILTLGPISVAPHLWGEGIGTALMTATIERATTGSWPVIVLLGDAGFYRRFGFEPARALGLEPPEPWPDEHWMARRLAAWTPAWHGTVRYPEAFGIGQ